MHAVKMNKFQKYYTKWKKPDTHKNVHTIWFYLCEGLELAKLW